MKPVAPVGSASVTEIPLTSACGGPYRHHPHICSTAVGSPSKKASTDPSARFATHPVTRRV
jgi:hypothetical protein